ncbi:MAG TPA: hypothetical protein VHX20_13640 [Terracidiphilus sp.]|jgi:hypothetical protein|nr:hypothetical protein [Terracidiphilus sp.]
MRTTIDIPDETYRTIKRIAVEDDSTVKRMVLEGLALLVAKRNSNPPRKRLDLPLIRSTRTDLLDIDNEKIYEIIDFP